MTKFNHFERLEGVESFIALPESFPVSGATLYEQGDKDITALHFHQCLEIGYCYEGSGIFIINEQVYPFVAGDATLIQGGVFHLAQSSKGTLSKWRFMSIDAKVLTNYLKDFGNDIYENWVLISGSTVIKQGLHQNTVNLIREIIEEYVNKNDGFQLLMRLKLGQLIINMNREQKNILPDLKLFNRKNFQKILPAVDSIIRDSSNPLKIDELAKLCNLSTAQFRRVFQSAIGVSPQKYIMQIRLQQAEQLLQNTQLKIIDIAQQVGFTTMSSFHRAFRLLKKQAPKNIRKNSN